MCRYKIAGLVLIISALLLSVAGFEKARTELLSIYTTIRGDTSKAGAAVLQEERTVKEASAGKDDKSLSLYALSACLMDADSKRILYAKDAYNTMPMASTTKIMTLLVVLENADLDSIVTVSENAARQPDVQLNINTGEQYVLRDLLYSLMLESHNDSAVAIAEHVGGTVEGFCEMMNAKAKAIGAYKTNFVTPNGLDADGHYTTAADLALIASYAVKNPDFVKITNTASYSFSEVNNKRSFNVNNKNRFLSMMEGANGVKTGFTGKAGYCFCGSLSKDGRNLISVVLASGWPPNKNYKWTDTTKLMKYGIDNFEKALLYEESGEVASIKVYNGKTGEAKICLADDVSFSSLICADDSVSIQYCYPDSIAAPVYSGSTAGYVDVIINDESVKRFELKFQESIAEQTYAGCFASLFNFVFK